MPTSSRRTCHWVLVCIVAGFMFSTSAARAKEPELDRALLPRGPVVIEDTIFNVEQVLECGSDATQALTVVAWEEGKTAGSLAVLHTFLPGRGVEDWRVATGLAHRQLAPLPEWPTVFSYEIEYVDGAKVSIPVRFGEGIREWHRVQTVGPMLWAREHWARDLDEGSTERLVAYAMRIPNPRPDQAVAALRAVPATDGYRDWGTALILAVALDEEGPGGRVYVVHPKPRGNDEQAGTFDAPFGTIQHALDVAEPGDSIYVRHGYYPLTAPLLKKFQGQEGKWLTLSAFPGETPTIDAYGIYYDTTQHPYGDGGTPLGHMQHDTGALHIWGDPDCTRVQGLRIVNSRRAGISVYGLREEADTPAWARWGATDQVEVAFNTTERTYSMGIISHQTDHLRVIGNRIIRPHALEMAYDPLTGEKVSEVALPQEAIDLSRNRNFEIAFNVVAGGAKEAIDCISVEDGVVHHNYVHSCLNGIYIDAWSVPIRRLDIHHNFVHNAYNGIPLSTEGSNDLIGFDIHHNIIVDAKSTAIGVGEATYKAEPAKVQQHRLYNNTIDNPGYHAAAIGWQSAGISVHGFRENPDFRDVSVFDNIVRNAAGMPLKNVYAASPEDRAIVFTHNMVWPSTDDATPAWLRDEKRSWVGGDLERGSNTIVADPRFVDPQNGDFRLAEGSPAIGAGREDGDLGAIPHGNAWKPGLDFAGTITAYYRGSTVWQPVAIAPQKYTLHRNNLQRPSWFQRGRYGPDFRDLPGGEQSLGGITWIIAPDTDSMPSVMALSGHSSESTADSITGIGVGRRADRLAFLHNAHVVQRRETPAGTQLFHYRVHYADGSQLDIPVRYGEQIDHWQMGRPRNLSAARLAWTERHIVRSGRFDYLTLFAFEWENPKPDLAIDSIDILRDADPLSATPAVFAISTGLNNN